MDNFIVSARKYRPDIFSSVIGQENITRTLKNSTINKQIAQAYLFCGPRGVGKTTCARIFAKVINCLNPTADHEPCNKCESCEAFNRAGSFNIHELDGASNNSVEDIRSLIEKVRIPPQIGHYSVYIIDEVHMLSSNAFNAFLKTLEEPPAHAIFILATTEKHKILPTILSRCQVYDFNRITVSDIAGRLSFVAKNEGVTIDSAAINIIAQKADGALRDALSIFDQIVSFSGKNVTYEQVLENLNVLDYEYYFRVTELLYRKQVPDVLLILDEIITRGFDPQYFIAGLVKHFRDLVISRVPETVRLLEVGDNFKERYLAQTKNLPLGFLYKAIEICNECDIQYKSSSNKRLLVELTLVRISGISDSAQPDAASVANTKESPAINSTNVSATTGIVKEKSVPYNTEKKTAQESQKKTSSEEPPAASGPGVTTFSIKGSSQKNSEEKKTESEKFAINYKEWNPENLISLWKDFAKDNRENLPSLSVSMQNTEPVISDNGKIVIIIENEMQKSEYIRNLDVLRQKFTSVFGSRVYDFNFNLVEPEHKKTIYTDSDKIKYFSENYQYFDEFRKRFGLEAL